MKKFLMNGFLAAVIALSCTCVSAETVIVGGNADKPPKQWEDESGEYKGIWIDLLKAIDRELPDIDFQISLLPWKRAYKGGVEGKNAMMSMFYNQERSGIFDYSDPVLEEKVVIAVKKGREFKFDSLDDLKGRRIGIYAGTSYGAEWQNAVDRGVFTVDEDFSNLQRLKKILAGLIDGGVFNPGTAAVKMLCDKAPDMRPEDFTVLERPVLAENSYFAIAKKQNRKDLIEKFNAGLRKIKQSGEYQQIIDKYSK
ncbi:MAG: transporter substrate-binding domain-containing protein [Desulfobacterales bacterium]